VRSSYYYPARCGSFLQNRCCCTIVNSKVAKSRYFPQPPRLSTDPSPTNHESTSPQSALPPNLQRHTQTRLTQPSGPAMSSLQDAELPPIEDEDVGVMGLTQVDPSPVEETPIEYSEKSYFPSQTQGEGWGPSADGVKRTGTLGLKLGDHGVVWWCTSAHPICLSTIHAREEDVWMKC
jgi:hypothetical protein